MLQLHHALVDICKRHTRAATAANRPAIGGRADSPNPNQPFGQRAMSSAYWFRLLLITLILIGVVATLVKLTWSNHTAPPRPLPKTGDDAAPVDAVPVTPTTATPAQSGQFSEL